MLFAVKAGKNKTLCIFNPIIAYLTPKHQKSIYGNCSLLHSSPTTVIMC